MPREVRPGEIIHGYAPEDGFLVRVTPLEIQSRAFAESLLEWIRSVLMCRFPAGAPTRICVEITNSEKRISQT